MANNYLEFSEVLTQLSEEEAAWLKNQLEIVFVFGDKEYAEGELPEGLAEKDADWVGCRAYRDMEDYEPDLYEGVGFAHKLYEKDADDRTNWGRHLWVYADESGDVDRVVHLVQKFLKKFRPDQCWSLTYATTCSKPRVGEFGGGAVFVTAKETKWQNASDFIKDQEQIFKLEGTETAVDAITNHIENDQREVDTAKMSGTWKCGECGWTTRLSYVDLAEIGTPLCSECDIEMTLLD